MLPTSKVQAIGLLVAVAVAGFASGAATITWAGEKDARDRRCERRSYSGMLQQELGLSDTQRDSLRTLLRNHRPRMRATMEMIRPQMDSLRAEMRAEVRAVLTPAQQAAYDNLLARERAERARADSVSNAQRHDHEEE